MLRRKKRENGVLKGPARVDRRTKDLIHRLRPGEVAVIDHDNLDRVSAEGLVERGALAVVNAGRSLSGSYPNAGPLVLARAGIPLVDGAGSDILDRIVEGQVIVIDGGTISVGDEVVASGVRLDGRDVEDRVAAAEASIGAELERFVRNTMEYLDRERDLILEGAGIPETRTTFSGRHALVVVRGHDYKEDLRTLRGYISEVRPVIVAVDGAADAILELGFSPDIIIGDMDSVSSAALTSGAELIVHAYPDGHAPGLERLKTLGLDPVTFPSAGTSEDIAMLLAYERGADLIVAVGSHANLVEFLDKGRGGMASTFLVRLKVGPKLVDAKGVNRLYRQDVSRGLLLLFVVSAFAVMVLAWYTNPALQLWFHNLWFRIRQLF